MRRYLGVLLVGLAALATGPAEAYQQGIASWYGSRLEGRRMANGERFYRRAPYCAHRSLPLGTRIQVRNLDTRKAATCLVTDRGPYRIGRIVDVSEAVARRIGLRSVGIAPARIIVVARR
ncbi:septal ring lytic transglycosylase RlpA family protein [Paracraurococcus lichenis]|uniref:Endolytic peptidoglycan transglycosylase RlpA n=1 Tax=Paracraurococcus lichenis TaxID=3064888 RepID=A0ABT9ECB1_9PROT|nr:septal ring lytic transglycosylase RlpA family protein [Paracraurococcus sp. LOR1-02]MDO9713842.1 septal ring lytic transglycosylase RlpA family protein [Paracraurococcus sp. LOR1-02]